LHQKKPETCHDSHPPHFLILLPLLSTFATQDDGSASDGRLVFRMKPLPPLSERRMFIKKVMIKTRADLWRVVHKAPSAVVEIPELEFEIGADAKRKIDSVYNHISGAVYNLSMHISTLGGQLSADTKEKITETVDQLNKLLDVDEPWTFMLHDRTGISEIRPEDDVETQYGGQVASLLEDMLLQCGRHPRLRIPYFIL
jgi:C4-type Zn-finger protein